MTPMNEKAVALLALAADRATTPPLRAFATRLRSAQEADSAASGPCWPGWNSPTPMCTRATTCPAW